MKQLLTCFGLACLISWTSWLPLYWRIFGLTGSILLTWLHDSTRASILIGAVFHSTIDIAFTADMADKNVVDCMGLLITGWGILTILIFKPKSLATHDREKNANHDQWTCV